MVMEDRPILSQNEKLAASIAGETTSRIVALDGTTAEDVIKKRNVEKFNNQVDQYVEKFEQHSTNLKEFADKINQNVNNIEIMPIGTYLLVKPFEENPFQRIVRDNKTGLIIDLGGQAPEYKNTDNGQIEEEESFIKVGVVQEVGPDCKYCVPGDTIMYSKPQEVPVPFYKQGLVITNEARILVVINEGLSERFKEYRNGK